MSSIQFPVVATLVDDRGRIDQRWLRAFQSIAATSGNVTFGLAADIPNAYPGAVYLATDTGAIYVSDTTTWEAFTVSATEGGILTGAVTKPAGSSVTTIAPVFTTPGTYGSASLSPVLTINAAGQVTDLSFVAIEATVAAAGVNGALQFNDSGALGGAAITYNSGTQGLSFASPGPTREALSPLTTEGDIFVRDATESTRLPIGTDGDYLRVDAGNPTWTTQDTLDEFGIVDGRRGGVTTGLWSGGVLSAVTGATTFDVSAGVAQFVDDSVDPLNPTVTTVTFGPFTGVTPDFLTTALVSIIGINSAGLLVQSAAEWTAEQRRSIVQLGLISHINLTNITAINEGQATLRQPTNQLFDLMNAIGPLNTAGNNYSATSTNLEIDKSAGTYFKLGSNYPTNVDDPHTTTLAATSPTTLRYRLSDGTQYPLTTDIDPANYESAPGVLSHVTPNKWTVQHIFLFSSNNTRLQYGQTLYNTASAAISGITTDPFVVEPVFAANAAFRCHLVVRGGASDLSDPRDAVFINASKFGSGIESSAVGAITAADIIAALGYVPGTVEDVSVVTANGVSGSVATSTTTPAITLTLGDITPTSVAASGSVTGSNLSGTNTGDQTITLTGDVTGSGTGSFATTLATVNASPQTDAFRKVTVNAKGLVTATSAVSAGDITPLVDGTYVNVSGDTMTGALGVISGSAGTPGLFFSGDTNTGIFRPGADQLSIATGGTQRIKVSNSGLFSAQQVLVRTDTAITTANTNCQLQVNGTTNSQGSLSIARCNSDVSGAILNLAKGRDAVGTTTTALLAGDLLGTINFAGADTSNYNIGAAIRVDAAENWSASSRGTAINLQTVTYGGTTPTTKLIVEADGRVGIGSASTLTDTGLQVANDIKGATTAYGVTSVGEVATTVTTEAVAVAARPTVASSGSTLTTLTNFKASPGTTNSRTITNMVGFDATTDLSGKATNTYGFRGSLAAASNTYNLYMDGTAFNYLESGLIAGGSIAIDRSANEQVGIISTNYSSGAGAAATLVLQNNTSKFLFLEMLSSGVVGYANEAWMYTVGGAPLIFQTSGTAIPDMRFDASGNVRVATTLGYAASAAGTVTQSTSKSTGVTLNKVSGQITMNAAAMGAGASATFTLTNSFIGATDVVLVTIKSGASPASYTIQVDATAAGSCDITVRRNGLGSLSEALVLNFVVFKAT